MLGHRSARFTGLSELITRNRLLRDLLVIPDFADEGTCRELIAAHSQLGTLSASTDNGLYLPVTKVKHPPTFRLTTSLIQRITKLIYRHFREQVGCDLALVCAITGNFCHTVHADNCKVVCPRHGDNAAQLIALSCQCEDVEVRPNHTSWRKYTALLYLDSDHEGGNIIFGEGPNRFGKIFREEICARSGLLVLSPSNEMYHHHTTPVTGGVRYSMNMWFTNDQTYICTEWE
jgi:hypothetical protein